MSDVATANVSSFSLFDKATLECPFSFFAAMRAQSPVHWVPEIKAYYVSRYEDIRYVKKNPQLFTNEIFRGVTQFAARNIAEEYRAKHGWARVSTLQRTDPPVHTHYRKLIDKTFTASRVKKMVPYIESVVHELIDAFADKGSCDFMRDFASMLPTTVIADQLGVPRDKVRRMKEWADAMLAPGGHFTDEAETIRCAKLVVEAQHYFAEVMDQRRKEPKDDMISDLVHVRFDDGRALDMNELQDLLDQLLTGGSETTTNALGSALMLLLKNPDATARLRADRSLIPNFIEEVLRYETPVLHLFRVATEDTELGGTKIPKGSLLALGYASANRDEDVFDDGERFDVCRKKAGAHLAFGSGPHFCPGAMLARQEMLSAFNILFDRLDDIRLIDANDPFEHVPHSFLRGLRTLNITFRSRRRAPVAAQ